MESFRHDYAEAWKHRTEVILESMEARMRDRLKEKLETGDRGAPAWNTAPGLETTSGGCYWELETPHYGQGREAVIAGKCLAEQNHIPNVAGNQLVRGTSLAILC
ncbi:hypothetical protein PoB_003048000 [Plakobranchus ocellatus]|uniref:Uncharacterized protein n=1 Tax=Plakobranchus ocellatus TaxID=259542 RepID=A0AAV4AAV5_9GAST|nr:hypothetical protein PoB_003048000 [Plakobranchus ocellatus]